MVVEANEGCLDVRLIPPCPFDPPYPDGCPQPFCFLVVLPTAGFGKLHGMEGFQQPLIGFLCRLSFIQAHLVGVYPRLLGECPIVTGKDLAVIGGEARSFHYLQIVVR